jgi:hypothetical protein
VVVSGWPTHEWQPWLVSTTQTSALYDAPRAEDTFEFRVTAFDRAGNSAQDDARTWVDRQLVYLPFSLIRNKWLPWHEQDPYEQNNSAPDAYGPLEQRRVYQSAIWDETDPADFYYFVPDVSGVVEITLRGIPSGVDLDLIVRIYDPGPPAQYLFVDASRNDNPWNADERVQFLATAGRKYVIEVQPYADRFRQSTDPNWQPNTYRLEWR